MAAKTVAAADVSSTDTNAVPSSFHGNLIDHHRGNVTTLSWRQGAARPHHHQSLWSHNLGYLQAQVKLQPQAQARLVVKPKANLAHAQHSLEQFPVSCFSSSSRRCLLVPFLSENLSTFARSCKLSLCQGSAESNHVVLS